MSTYYLFDMHVPDLEDARIVDVVTTTPGAAEFRVDGLTPIRVPDGVRVKDPGGLSDLLAQKYLGLLAMYPGFRYIRSDDLLDSTGVEVSPSSKMGSRGTIGGIVRTASGHPNLNTSPILITSCVLLTEQYVWKYVNRREGRVERYYVELPDESTHELSVNGGATSYEVTTGALFEFSPEGAGSSIRLTLNNGMLSVDGRLVHTGSWALIY